MSSFVRIHNKNKGPTQELNDTTLTAETKHPINLTPSGKRKVYTIMEPVVAHLLMLQEHINSEQKTLK